MREEKPRFAYADDVAERYPAIHAGILHATGLGNGPSSSELVSAYRAEQQVVLERRQATAIADLPSIAAWRRAFAAFGAKPTQYRSAPESLLRRLSKQGDIPSINTLVDIGNLVSIRYAIPVAVFDLADVVGTITVRFATGEERFVDLGSSDVQHADPGEVIFVDEDDAVCARRWCWRQSARTATEATTTDALIVVEGLHPGAEDDIGSALADLTTLLGTHQPDCRIESRRRSALDA